MRSTTAYRHRLWFTCVLTFTLFCSSFGATSATAARKFWRRSVTRPTATSSTTTATTPETISKDELRRHITKLASDEFKGRNPAGEGGILAARYIVEEFKKIGLKPAGDDGGYLQPFTLSLPRYLCDSSGRKMPQVNADASSAAKDSDTKEASAQPPNSYRPMSEEELNDLARKLNCWLKNRVREFFFECESYECRNVLGMLPGSDPQLKDEVILVSAHYDHLGVQDGEVYNGADDNASGTASMLEIARVLKEQHDAGKGPARSILFAAWDAEEKGLCGSWNWTAEPTIPLKQVVAVINLDMIGRLQNNRLLVLGSDSSSELDDLVTAQAKEAQVRLHHWKKSPRSDHWPFFVSGIPCLTFCTGPHDQYHSPQDDVQWIHFTNLSRIARMSLKLVTELANRDKPVQFTADNSK